MRTRENAVIKQYFIEVKKIESGRFHILFNAKMLRKGVEASYNNRE
jgi:hypothetical protein